MTYEEMESKLEKEKKEATEKEVAEQTRRNAVLKAWLEREGFTEKDGWTIAPIQNDCGVRLSSGEKALHILLSGDGKDDVYVYRKDGWAPRQVHNWREVFYLLKTWN